MSKGRAHYTDEEDRYLVEYLALSNPEKAGRMGNTLYKNLTENEEKWPWAVRHSWQSWRERYKSQEEWFDRKVRKYLKAYGGDGAQRAVPQTKKNGKLGDSGGSGSHHVEQPTSSGDVDVPTNAKRKGDSETDNAQKKRKVGEVSGGVVISDKPGSTHKATTQESQQTTRPITDKSPVCSNAVDSATLGEALTRSLTNDQQAKSSVKSIYPSLAGLECDQPVASSSKVTLPGTLLDETNTPAHNGMKVLLNNKNDQPQRPTPASLPSSQSSQSRAEPSKKKGQARKISATKENYFAPTASPSPPEAANRVQAVSDADDTVLSLRSAPSSKKSPLHNHARPPPRLANGAGFKDGPVMGRRVSPSKHFPDVDGDDSQQEAEPEVEPIKSPPTTHVLQTSSPPAVKDIFSEDEPSSSSSGANSPQRVLDNSNEAGPSRIADGPNDASCPSGTNSRAQPSFLRSSFDSAEVLSSGSVSGAEASPLAKVAANGASAFLLVRDPNMSGKRPLRVRPIFEEDKKKRRETFGGFDAGIGGGLAPGPVDDRASHSLAYDRKLHARASSPFLPPDTSLFRSGRSRRSSSIASTVDLSVLESPPSTMSESDRRRSLNYGFQELLKGMAENHNFSLELVRSIYDAQKDLQATDELLCKMREAAEQVALAYIHGSGTSNASRARREEKSREVVLVPPQRRPRPSGPHPLSNVIPIHPSPKKTHDPRSFSPPSNSRAAQFVKLAREGRGNEALHRERRRVGERPSLEPRREDHEPNRSGPSHNREDTIEIDPVGGIPADPILTSTPNGAKAPEVKAEAWTAEEDAIILGGDEDAMEELDRKKGIGSVRMRGLELMAAARV